MDNPDPAIPNRVAESGGDNPIAAGGSAPPPPEEGPGLCLEWNVRVTSGESRLAEFKGLQEFEIFDYREDAGKFFRVCDEFFEAEIARPMLAALRARFLENGAESEPTQDREVDLKVAWEFKIWRKGTPVRALSGSSKRALKPDRQSNAGQLGLLELAWQSEIFNPVKVEFRGAVAYLVDADGASASEGTLWKLILQEIRTLSKPQMVGDDEFPPTIPGIDVRTVQNRRQGPSSQKAFKNLTTENGQKAMR